jgi:hypothetical protein
MMSMKNIMGKNKTNIGKVWENCRNKYENTSGSIHTVQKFSVFVFYPEGHSISPLAIIFPKSMCIYI